MVRSHFSLQAFRLFARLIAVVWVCGFAISPVAAQPDDDDDEPAAPAPSADDDEDDPPAQPAAPAADDDEDDPPARPAAPAADDDEDDPPAQPAAPAADDDEEPARPVAADDGDTDHDGTPNSRDTDDDGDGTPDVADKDDDGDGTPDDQVRPAAVGDSDGDGSPDAVDTDDDGDGTPDVADKDDDGDGTPDDQERPAAVGDSDGDGSSDAVDTDDDGDGTPDVADKDDDGDGTPDDQERPAAVGDSDGDGSPDAVDTDDDGDGVPDAADKDDDGDGILDDQERLEIVGDTDGDDSDGDGSPDAVDTDDDGDGVPDAADKDDDGDGILDDQERLEIVGDTDGDGVRDVADSDDEGKPYIDDDSDGDGKLEPREIAEGQEFNAAFAAIPNDVDEAALDARPLHFQLVPSMDVGTFRTLIKFAKRKVLARLEAKITKKANSKMAKVSWLIFFFSLSGFLLLAMPLVLRKKYPGQTKNLFKYSALAAVTFCVAINLFGVIMIGLRTAQNAVSVQTNPQLNIASGFFDSLDRNAEDYIVMGKELFAPTLKQLTAKGDDPPPILLIENGQKIIHDTKVFRQVAAMFKKVNFLFGIIPFVLMGVTLVLFILAIKPTLIEIIKLPATVAEGNANAGTDVVKRALRQVGGEMLATLSTVGVLVLLTLLAGFVLGQVVEPALDSIISYFTLAVTYLQFVKGASTGQVTLMLFSVILFLVINLGVVIASMSFFLGKSQKIFQQRFNHAVPLAEHRRWWKWAVPAVILAQVLPWLYVRPAALGVEEIENRIMEGVVDAEKINWTLLMLAGPMFLVVGFLLFFWAVRGLRAITFMATYKIKLPVTAPGIVVPPMVPPEQPPTPPAV